MWLYLYILACGIGFWLFWDGSVFHTDLKVALKTKKLQLLAAMVLLFGGYLCWRVDQVRTDREVKDFITKTQFKTSLKVEK